MYGYVPTLRSQVNQYIGQRQTTLAASRRQRAEEQYTLQQQLVGSDQQFEGIPEGLTAEVAPYTRRYTFDPAAGNLRFYNESQRTLGQQFLQKRTDNANAILQRAEDAARAGNFQEADQLREEARLSLTKNDVTMPGLRRGIRGRGPFGDLGDIEGLESIWDLEGDPRIEAFAALQSPTAQIVGNQLREARAFQDWNSEESVRERQLLREPGERAIRSQEREALRGSRMERLRSGVGQRSFASQQINERTREGFSAQLAQLESDVSSSFNEYRRQYASNAVAFAQNWAANTGGVRQEFQNNLDAIFTGMSDLAVQYDRTNAQNFQTGLNYSMYQQNRRDVARQQRDRLITGATTALLGGLTQGYLGNWSGGTIMNLGGGAPMGGA